MARREPPAEHEARTIRLMIEIYCRGRHGSQATLCAECRELLDYACARLDRCPWGAQKPNCAQCTIHCYRPAMRARVKEVMRYAGPRMALRHPILALRHQWRGLKKPPERKPSGRNRNGESV